MKKSLTLPIIGLLMVFFLAGCGAKSQEDVIKSLSKKMDEMTGYRTNATMTLQTGDEQQSYDIEIWHKKDDFYRVELKSAKKEQSQIILRNKDGVFVLTPALNKSFKFQSEWPYNSSQAYLFESLAEDIMKDDEAAFTAADDHYVFVTKTNYQNQKTLPKQEITLAKDDLSPVRVRVMDQDNNPLVQVDFFDFHFNADIEEGAFDVKRNMSGAQIDTPTMAQPESNEFSVLYPTYVPEGINLIEEKEVESEHGKRIVLTYAGPESSFTLYQEVATIMPANSPVYVDGEPVDLGFSVGVLTDDSISWTNDGVQYYLASKDLASEELLQIARSVQGQAAK